MKEGSDNMIKLISINKGSNLEEILFFNKMNLEQATLLFGANGVGKSSLIKGILKQKEIKFNCDKEIKLYSYINNEQNFRNMNKNSNLSYEDMFNPYLINKKYNAEELSEGQSIIYSLQDIFELCVQIKDDSNDSIILLDEIDSGLSIDNVDYLSDKIKEITDKYSNIQFIITFNNFEFCRNFPKVFNMYNGKYITIESYEQYRNIINSNREMLLEKRHNNMFTGDSDF